jgi:hypothetical protein
MFIFFHTVGFTFFVFGGFVLFGRDEVCFKGEGFGDDVVFGNFGENVFENDVNP